MEALRYTVLLLPDADGGFTVTVPALPGCVAEGDTIDEALAMAREAVSLVLRDMQASGDPVPREPMPAAVLEAALAKARAIAREAAGLPPDAPLGALELQFATVAIDQGTIAAA